MVGPSMNRNLVPVQRYRDHQVRLVCVSCHELTPEVDCLADLSGEPFKDYYCKVCIDQEQANEHI